MSWLVRLKTGKTPEAHATKPTKPIPDPQNRGFVGFVASIPELLPKTAAPAEAANDPAPDLRKPESDHGRVTLAPGTTAATAEKFRAASLALDDDISANGQTTDPDRWCWPHSSAMNERELDTFTLRLETFTSKGLRLHEAEAQADVLVQRDRTADDRRLCLECIHLQGGPGRRRCGNGVVAGIGLRAADTQLPSDLTHQLQRCAGFTNLHGQGANS